MHWISCGRETCSVTVRDDFGGKNAIFSRYPQARRQYLFYCSNIQHSVNIDLER